MEHINWLCCCLHRYSIISHFLHISFFLLLSSFPVMLLHTDDFTFFTALLLCCCVSFCSLLDGVCLSGNKKDYLFTYLMHKIKNYIFCFWGLCASMNCQTPYVRTCRLLITETKPVLECMQDGKAPRECFQIDRSSHERTNISKCLCWFAVSRMFGCGFYEFFCELKK